jgi:hypothetical protein
MVEIHPLIHVGTVLDCPLVQPDWAVVHACKSPCHQRAVGYRGSLPSTHPNYLVLERDPHLYLNMIDPPIPLFKLSLFTSFLSFATRQLDRDIPTLIHCNQGESRAPTLALLLLSKKLGVISTESFESARYEFRDKFPAYAPGIGIQRFVTEHWSEL